MLPSLAKRRTLFPREGPFAPHINEWHDQDHRKDHQLDEANDFELAHQDRQRDERGRLHVEDDEEHTGGEILHWETLFGRLNLLDAALVGCELLRRRLLWPEDKG